jgi:polyisoprenoid-binding protein YceI
MKTPSFLLSAAALLSTGAVPAVEFDQVAAERSRITFTSRQMGVPVDGGFSRFTARLHFDPAAPAAAAARIEIQLASIDTGSAEANAEVVGKEWLDVQAFPTAVFESSGVTALGGDRFAAAGRLTIKGKTRNLNAPFSFLELGGQGVFDGEFVIRRLDFGIGEGAWSDLDTVADEVRVRFHLVATATSPVQPPRGDQP